MKVKIPVPRFCQYHIDYSMSFLFQCRVLRAKSSTFVHNTGKGNSQFYFTSMQMNLIDV